MAIKLEHPDLAQHQASLVLQMREFWMEGHLCDVVVKSRDGTEYNAHRTVLSAASPVLKALLGGEFSEAKKKEEPVELCTSDASVAALLDFIYGGNPEVPLEESIELLGLVDAYNLPRLAKAIEVGLRASLEKAPVATALRILRESHSNCLNDLNDACEDHVAFNFEASTQHPGFLELSATQLGRLLQRSDLNVPREDVVLQGTFRWLNHSKDRDPFLGLLLQQIDFPSISLENLARIDCFAAGIGPKGGELQRQAVKAVQALKKRSRREPLEQLQPKRRRLQHVSPGLGASAQGVRKVLSGACTSVCWHENAIHATISDRANCLCRVLCWKPGSKASEAQVVIGQGATAGIKDLATHCHVYSSLTGELFVAERNYSTLQLRLLSFRNGFGQVVQDDVNNLASVSPHGVLYFRQDEQIQKLVGSRLQPITADLSGPIFVTTEEVVYFADNGQGTIMRISPGETEPTLVGKVTGRPACDVSRLFVTGGGRIYAIDRKKRKVWAFDPGSTTCFEVLQWPAEMMVTGVVEQDRSLYVGMRKKGGPHILGGLYEYALPPVLQLE